MERNTTDIVSSEPADRKVQLSVSLPRRVFDDLFGVSDERGDQYDIGVLVEEAVRRQFSAGSMARIERKLDYLLAVLEAPNPHTRENPPENKILSEDESNRRRFAEAFDRAETEDVFSEHEQVNVFDSDYTINPRNASETRQLVCSVSLEVKDLVEEHADGPRKQGRVVSQAVARLLYEGTWAHRIEKKIELGLGEAGEPVPDPSEWAQQRLQRHDGDDYDEMYADTLESPEDLDVDRLTMDDTTVLSEGDVKELIQNERVKQTPSHRRPLIMAMMRRNERAWWPRNQIKMWSQDVFGMTSRTAAKDFREIEEWCRDDNVWGSSPLREAIQTAEEHPSIDKPQIIDWQNVFDVEPAVMYDADDADKLERVEDLQDVVEEASSGVPQTRQALQIVESHLDTLHSQYSPDEGGDDE